MIIRENRNVCPGYYRIVFEAPFLARVSCAGQFCLVSVPGVFLRRPLSITGSAGKKLSFLYRVVGPGTANLAALKAGTAVTVLGPLGNGYDLRPLKKGITPVLVAGGTGIASLAFLAQQLPRVGVLFFGARCAKDLVALEGFRKRGWKIHLATEDGSRGHRGYVTDRLLEYAAAADPATTVLYACGPHPMLEKVAEIARTYRIEGYVSLEEMMACGLGNCQGCAVKIQDSYKMVCKDGPVFAINDVAWRNA